MPRGHRRSTAGRQMRPKKQMRELNKRVTRRKDISKSRKLCLLSVRILLGFTSRQSPTGFESASLRLEAVQSLPLCRGDMEHSFIKGKHADVLPMKSERKPQRLPVCCLKGNFSSSRSDGSSAVCLKIFL